MLKATSTKVYLAPGATDMRAGVHRLSVMVQSVLAEDPFSGHLFGFCNRRRDAIKLLYWDRNGFCLWHKRLERHRFHWPENQFQAMTITSHQLGWLLDGLSLHPHGAHPNLQYKFLV